MRLLAERLQCVDGPLLRLRRAVARAVDAERRRVRGLPIARVAAGVLAERRGVLLHLEQVVANLEHEPDVARERIEARALRCGERAELGRHHDRRANQLAGLAPVDLLETSLVEPPAFRFHVECLSADHARGPGGACEPADDRDLALWCYVKRRIGRQYLERERLQTVAGKNRRGFV